MEQESKIKYIYSYHYFHVFNLYRKNNSKFFWQRLWTKEFLVKFNQGKEELNLVERTLNFVPSFYEIEGRTYTQYLPFCFLCRTFQLENLLIFIRPVDYSKSIKRTAMKLTALDSS